MKSDTKDALGLYSVLLDEARLLWPELTKSLDRDFLRLQSLDQRLGWRLYGYTLPQYGHWFDRCLDYGAIPDGRQYLYGAEIPRGVGRTREGRPLLFKGVLSRVFDQSEVLRCFNRSNGPFSPPKGSLWLKPRKPDGDPSVVHSDEGCFDSTELEIWDVVHAINWLRMAFQLCSKVELPSSRTALRKSLRGFLQCGVESTTSLSVFSCRGTLFH
jgi:hypothetical protein